MIIQRDNRDLYEINLADNFARLLDQNSKNNLMVQVYRSTSYVPGIKPLKVKRMALVLKGMLKRCIRLSLTNLRDTRNAKPLYSHYPRKTARPIS